MSEEIIKRLEGENTRVRVKLKTLRADLEKTTKALEEANQARQQYEGQVGELRTALDSGPQGTVYRENERLKGEIRTRDHREAFIATAKELKVRPDAVHDLWGLSGYKAETDSPEPAIIRQAIEGALQSRPYLVEAPQAVQEVPQAQAQPQFAPTMPATLIPTPGASRGVAVNPTGLVFTKSEMRNPIGAPERQKAIADAGGKFTVIEG